MSRGKIQRDTVDSERARQKAGKDDDSKEEKIPKPKHAGSLHDPL